jgi:hypothetical protein
VRLSPIRDDDLKHLHVGVEQAQAAGRVAAVGAAAIAVAEPTAPTPMMPSFMIFPFDPLFADLSQFDCALGTRRHGNTIVAQLPLEHGNPWSGIASWH